jgi:predicted N-acetyltransferase YhbS
MLRIRRMNRHDIPFAIRLTNQEDWGVTSTALHRLLNLNPRGSFIAHDGTARLGMLTTTSYGRDLAWIGNVIVDREHRGKRIGNSMVKRAVEFLQDSGIRHIALYCFNENVRFYENLGFAQDKPFLRLKRKAARTTSLRREGETLPAPPLNRIILADKKAFGADRSKLIRAVLADGDAWYVCSTRGTKNASYLMVKEYTHDCELGPWIHDGPSRNEPVITLNRALSAIKPVPVEVACLRENRNALNILRANGFQVVREGCRMFFEDVARIGKDSAQWALGFLDKG